MSLTLPRASQCRSFELDSLSNFYSKLLKSQEPYKRDVSAFLFNTPTTHTGHAPGTLALRSDPYPRSTALGAFLTCYCTTDFAHYYSTRRTVSGGDYLGLIRTNERAPQYRKHQILSWLSPSLTLFISVLVYLLFLIPLRSRVSSGCPQDQESFKQCHLNQWVNIDLSKFLFLHPHAFIRQFLPLIFDILFVIQVHVHRYHFPFAP
jgi:hypothetical protein